MQRPSVPRLSVVIPALNEAATLPALLAALQGQTRRPDEIIVADAGSQDGTVALAEAAGARVVAGGRPAAGRNAGARAASGELLLFLDADVLPGADFVERALHEFEADGYVVATCRLEPLNGSSPDQILTDFANAYMQLMQSIAPHAAGCCIFCRSEVHSALGGFDETVVMGEDHDFVRRAARLGPFGVLTSVYLPISMRRVEKEGLARLAVKYLWCEAHVLTGTPIHALPFEYEFGAYAPHRPAIDGDGE